MGFFAAVSFSSRVMLFHPLFLAIVNSADPYPSGLASLSILLLSFSCCKSRRVNNTFFGGRLRRRPNRRGEKQGRDHRPVVSMLAYSSLPLPPGLCKWEPAYSIPFPFPGLSSNTFPQ